MQPGIVDYFHQHDLAVYVPGYRHLYIAMIIIAIVLSTILAAKKGLPVFKFYISTLLILFFAFVGGRIYFELRYFDVKDTKSIISDIILGIGTESVGVYIGGVIGAILVLRWMKIDLLKAFDVYAPVLALSLVIGRIGCLMGGCCFGKPTTLPWGISFPSGSHAYLSQLEVGLITAGHSHALPVHPTQIYEAIFGLGMFIFLLCSDRIDRLNGIRLFLYLSAYAAFRFFIEFLRADERGMLFRLSYPQLFSIVLFLSSVIAICVLEKKKAKQD